MENFLKSLLGTVSDRLKNIFVGAFVLSWIGWNWKYIYITLFVSENLVKAPSYNKFEYITSFDTNIWFLLLYPFFTAIGYIILLPLINVGANAVVDWYKIWNKRNYIKRNKKRPYLFEDIEIARESYATELEDTEKKLTAIEKISNKRKQTIADKDLKIKELNEFLKALKISNSELNDYAVDSVLELQTLNKVVENEILIKKIDGTDLLKRVGFEKSVRGQYLVTY